jgi:hypothetical protein
MFLESKKYIKYLELVQFDIREEFDLLGLYPAGLKICDFGCGDGITTFGLALEAPGSQCIGIDLFDNPSNPTPEILNQYIEIVKTKCNPVLSSENPFPSNLCKLIADDRIPRFVKGNIVLNQNIPQEIDLAYCKKLLVNILGKNYKDTPLGENALTKALKNISNCIQPDGLLCVIEYDKEFSLAKYLNRNNLRIIRKTQLKRNEIRSKGRTKTTSLFTLYLCQKYIKDSRKYF